MSKFRGNHQFTEQGDLAGGMLVGGGLSASWASDPDEQTGVGPMLLVEALIERLRALNESKYRCDEFEASLIRAEEIKAYLTRRGQDRRFRGVEGSRVP
jgi:hypothetical protein